MNDIQDPGPLDPDDIHCDDMTPTDPDPADPNSADPNSADPNLDEAGPELERRLAAALRAEYRIESVSDDDIAALRAHLEPSRSPDASAPAPTVAILHDRTSRQRSRTWRTGLLVAAAVAVVALIGGSTTLWSTATPDQTPATVPSVSSTAPVDDTTQSPTAATPTTTDAEMTPSTTTGSEATLPTTGQVAVTFTNPEETSPATDPVPSVDPPAPTSAAEVQTPFVAADPQTYRVDDSRFEVPGQISFTSPSGNIYCIMADQGVPGASCQISTADFSSLTCTDRGLLFEIRAAGTTSDMSTTPEDTVGRYAEACGTGLFPTSPPVLGYGTSLTLGGFTCTSETTGVTCRNDDTGAGFSVSRAAYRLF